MQSGVESAHAIRASVASAHGQLDPDRWCDSSASCMKSVWLTDCRSVAEALKRESLSKVSDKKRGIEFAALRPSLWKRTNDVSPESSVHDERPNTEEATDLIRWVDIVLMITDPLTKAMDPENLIEVFNTNHWNLSQSIESLQKKGS